MRARRRTNLLWGLALLAAAAVAMARALGVLPEPIYDLLARTWPALLVLAGLSIVLRPRVIFGSGVALLITLVLVGGVAALAFSTRATQIREDYREPVEQTVSGNVTLLRVRIRTLATDIELLRRVGAERVISGEFVGSAESRVEIIYNEGAVDADFSLMEEQANPLPMLENIGRGTLRLEFPAELPLDIELVGLNGSATLNMSGLAVERMNLDLQTGNALVTLPVYDPLGSGPDDPLGTLAVRDGDITLFIDPQIAARLELNRGGSGIDPLFDPIVYNYLVGDVLEARSIATAEIIVRYAVTALRGQITVREPL